MHKIFNQQHASIQALQKQNKEVRDAFNKNEGENKALKKMMKKKDKMIKGLNTKKAELKYQYMQDIEASDLKRSLAEKTVKDQKLKIARMESCHNIHNKKMQEKVDSANKATDYAIDLLNSDEDKFNLMVGTSKKLNDKNKCLGDSEKDHNLPHCPRLVPA